MTGDDRNPAFLEQVELALTEWTDERIISAEDIRTWYLFNVYIVNLADDDGWRYDGHSFSMGQPMSLLVVRGTLDGIPHVVFSSGRTTTECVRTFLRKLQEGWLEWSVDRFRT